MTVPLNDAELQHSITIFAASLADAFGYDAVHSRELASLHLHRLTRGPGTIAAREFSELLGKKIAPLRRPIKQRITRNARRKMARRYHGRP